MTSEPIDPAALDAIRASTKGPRQTYTGTVLRLLAEVDRLADALAERDRRIAEAWDEGFDAAINWIRHQHGRSVSMNPPRNPHALTPDQQARP